MKIAVIGAGESGVGAALLAKKLNYEIFVSDGGKIKQGHKMSSQSMKSNSKN